MLPSALNVGVLALQGAFAKHAEMLIRLGVNVVEVRKPSDLSLCDALIIPGGESTTISKQIHFINFADPFCRFAEVKPVFGTCAGLILMSHKIEGDAMQPFNLLDVVVERNAFGRQVESFETKVDYNTEKGTNISIPAVFIRAPRIKGVGKDVKILATLNDEPVLVQQGFHLGSTFHPELTSDPTIHLHFLHLIKK